MYDNKPKDLSYTTGFFILLVFAGACLFVASLLGGEIWVLMTGKSLHGMADGMKDPANSNALKVIQVVTAVVGFFIPTWIAASMLDYHPFVLIGFLKKIRWTQVGPTLAILFVGLFFLAPSLSYLNQHIPLSAPLKLKFDNLENSYNGQIEAIIGLNNIKDLILGLIILAIVPAICEETFFRGGLQNFLTRSTRMPWLSVIIVSLIFSAAHFSYYGFLPRFALGMILGLLYRYSGSIWLNILAHFLNNGLALIVIYVFHQQGKSIAEATNASDSGNTIGYWGLLSLPLLIFLFSMLKKASVRQNLPSASISTNHPHGF